MLFVVVVSVFSKVTEENGEQMPCYFVMVSLQEVGGVETKNWTVPRRLSEFQNLHRKLSEVCILMNTRFRITNKKIFKSSFQFLHIRKLIINLSPFAMDTGKVAFSVRHLEINS